MRQFFKFMFASMLGFILAGIILIFILVAVVSNLASSKSESAISENAVLEITFKSPVTERTAENPFENFNFDNFETTTGLGLNDIVKNIKKAEGDSKVKGIFLNLSNIDAGIATIEEIRQAILDFRNTRKFVYAYSEGYSQGAYYLATAADKIFVHPQGSVDWHGLGAQLSFYKGTLEKLEVEPQVIRHGKFKSAVEPYILDKMSDENREQTRQFVGSIWNYVVKNVASQRKKSVSEIQLMADSLTGLDANNALSSGMVDEICYYDEMLSRLKRITGTDTDKDINFVGLKKYDRAPGKSFELSAKKIAVIYAVGEINSGKGNDNSIGSETTAKAIRDAAKDSSIKAIVLRVNSPGGSALASDVIWREVVMAKKLKPVIASMGDVAASGGYYISCGADAIVAQPNTITGSIGVFGLLFNAQKLFNNKLGITFDTLNTGAHAGLGSIQRPLTVEEKNIVQREVEKIYDTFLTRVSEGRNIAKADVDSIAQGRVWSGVDAKKLKLIDEFGNLNTAITLAAKKAKLDKFRTISLPEQKDFLRQIMDEQEEENASVLLKTALGDQYNLYRELKSLLTTNGIQARMPYSISIQ